jgi:hypothetical protein
MGLLRIFGLIILLSYASPAWAQSHGLLLDRSGSMRGYYDGGLMRDLSESVFNVLQPHGPVATFAFSSEVRPLRTPNEVDQLPWGAFTYLDRAIDHVIRQRFAIAWMVTDNVQDQPNAPEVGNTEVFYRSLRGEAVKKVVIFPLLQPPGSGGIVIYAMLLDASRSDVFETEIKEFLSSVSGAYRTEALRMKPLDRETIEIKVIKTTLQSKKGKPYQEGQIIRESLEVRFKSRFDHLKIVNAKIEVPRAETDFGSQSLLKPEKMDITVTPVTVKSLDPQGETEELYTVAVDLGEVRLKKDPASLWKAAFGKSKEDVTLRLTFLINVPQENFRFRDQFLNTYNASNLSSARATGRIYGIERLPLLLGKEMTAITTETQIPLEVNYPWWPAVVLLLGFLLLGAIGVGGGWYLMSHAGELIGRKQWKVRATTEFGAPVASEVTDEGEVIVQASTIGQINGNKFLPLETVTVLNQEDEMEKIALEDGLRLKVSLARAGTFLLTFEVAQEGEEEGGSYTPGRR